MSKLFIEVDAGKEQPTRETESTSINVTCFDAEGDCKSCWYNFKMNRWECGNDSFHPVVFLRPIQQQEGLYTIEQITGFAEWIYNNSYRQSFGDIRWFNSRGISVAKTTSELFNQFINSIK